MLSVDIVWLGWLSAVVGLTSSVGAYLLTKLPSRRVNLSLLLGSLFVVGLGSMVYVGTNILWVAILGQAINGLAWGFLEPVQMILVQEDAPMAKLGRVMGFMSHRDGKSRGLLVVKRMKIAGILLLVSSVLLAVSAFFGLAGSLALVFSDEDMLREVSSALAVEGFGGSEASAILFMVSWP